MEESHLSKLFEEKTKEKYEMNDDAELFILSMTIARKDKELTEAKKHLRVMLAEVEHSLVVRTDLTSKPKYEIKYNINRAKRFLGLAP